MSIPYVDTTEIESIADSLISLSDEYISEINKLFTRLSEVPVATKEWTGVQSKKYYKVISADKNSFLEVGNQLKYIGKKIRNDALDISSCVKDCKSNEGKKGY